MFFAEIIKECFCLIPGSGSLAAMSVFESRYKPDLEVKLGFSSIPIPSQ